MPRMLCFRKGLDIALAVKRKGSGFKNAYFNYTSFKSLNHLC